MQDKSQQIERISKTLEESLQTYLHASHHDDDMVLLVGELVSAFSHSLATISHAEPASKEDIYDVKAGLYGAAKVLDLTWEKKLDQQHEEHEEDESLSRRFLELTRKRIGEV